MAAELIGALCTILAFTCAGQILLTGTLAFGFSHFLTLSQCNFATAAGVISGFVAVPMVVQLKTAQISTKVEIKYGYTIWYQRMAIGVCILMHFASSTLALYSILRRRDRNEAFFQHMTNYTLKQTSKSLVDNIQWALQCCGAKSYEDWFTLDWAKTKRANLQRDLSKVQKEEGIFLELSFIVNTKPRQFRTVDYILVMGFIWMVFHNRSGDFYNSDSAATRGMAVPFSCCTRKVLRTCLHYDVLKYGTQTINTSGCGLKVQYAAHMILWMELFIYTGCILIELSIMCAMRMNAAKYDTKKETNFMLYKYFNLTKSKRWSKFSNEMPEARRNELPKRSSY